MVLLEILRLSDREQWESYTSRSEHQVFWKMDYLRLYQDEGEPEAAVYEDSRGFVFYPYLKRKIVGEWLPDKFGTFYDITSAYGFGGPIIQVERGLEKGLFADFRQNFDKYCLSQRIISEFIRFHPLHSDPDIVQGHIELVNKGPNIYVDLQRFQTDEEFLMSYRASIRYEIRKAIKNNVTVEIEQAGTRLDEFMNIYNHTMNRNQAKSYYYKFDKLYLQKLIANLEGHAVFFHAKYEGKLISTALALYDKESIYIYLAGSLEEYFKVCPNVLIYHTILKWAKEQGIKFFLLGGGHDPNDGILKHKRGYVPNGQQEAVYHVGQKTHNPFIYNRFATLKKKHSARINPHYFPIYRSN